MLAYFLIVIWLVGCALADYRDSVIIQTKESYYSNQTSAYKHAFFLYYLDGQVFRFPDRATYEIVLQELNHKVTILPESVVNRLLKVDDLSSKQLLPSVINHAKVHEDSFHLRLMRSAVLEKSVFIDDKSVIYLEEKVNPSVVHFHHRMLVVYSDKGKVAFVWQNPVTGQIDDSMELWGLGGKNKHPVVYSKQQEDPRLLKLSDHSLLLTFSATQVVGPNKVQATYCYTFLTYSAQTKTIGLGDIVSFESELDTQQKNWMPYERNESIFFYHSIYPGRVLKLLGHTVDLVAVTEEVKGAASNPAPRRDLRALEQSEGAKNVVWYEMHEGRVTFRKGGAPPPPSHDFHFPVVSSPVMSEKFPFSLPEGFRLASLPLFNFTQANASQQSSGRRRLQPRALDFWAPSKLPWQLRYGNTLHGGGGALPLPPLSSPPYFPIGQMAGGNAEAGSDAAVSNPPLPPLHLFFFHTTDFSTHPYQFFWGAGLFCSDNPRVLFAISSLPIIKPWMYAGKLFSRRVGYIVFPGGGSMNPNKENTLTMAMGLQDSRGVIFDVKIRELVSSLTFVQDCPRA